MTPKEIAEKYHQLTLDEGATYARTLMTSTHRHNVPVASEGDPGGVRFYSVAPIDIELFRSHCEGVANNYTVKMLLEIWQSNWPYERMVEAMCHKLQLQNSLLAALPFSELVRSFQHDYPRTRWEANCRMFAQSRDNAQSQHVHSWTRFDPDTSQQT